jgi:RimJ/RimL family protein N-acetyltransferase
MDAMVTAIWPLFGLTVSTPRVTLRYVTDELAGQLADLAARGIHDPGTMPFSVPWTDVAPPELQRNTFRYFWRCRAETTSQRWNINLAVLTTSGTPVGVCTIDAENFPTSRAATTGSWIGREYQGCGLGKEMRHAALHLIFTGFGADTALTRAWHDNTASLRVTRSLPYLEQAPVQEQRRSRLDTMLTFAMSRERWETVERNDIAVDGVRGARELLGLSVE